jgi:hypothetical protein
MKNLHLIATDKPSVLILRQDRKLFFTGYGGQLGKIHGLRKDVPKNIYITNDEEIKEGDWFMSDFNSFPIHNIKELSERGGTLGWKQKDLKNNLKIILTTDQDLIGVQPIDDEFLEWFVKNPSCEEVETFVDTMGCSLENCNGNHCVNYKIIIPKEELKQETLEEAIKREYEVRKFNSDFPFDPQSFKLGAKWMEKHMEKLKDFETWKEWKNN